MERSPQPKARLAGVFYLLTIITGSLALAFGGAGQVVSLVATGCYVAVTLLFYGLFKPVSRALSLLAAVVSLVGCAVSVLGVFQVAPVHINSLVFFGFYCLLIGYLILRSTFLPRILGVLMAFGGLGWLTYLSPSFAKHLSPFNMLPGVVAEGLLTLWLLLFGVNVQRWRERARATGNDVSSAMQP